MIRKPAKTRRSSRSAARTVGVVLLAMLLLAAAFVVTKARSEGIALVHPARHVSEQTPADFADFQQWEDVRLTTSDGLSLAAWFAPPKQDGGAAIVFVHGLGGNRGSMLPQAAFIVRQGYGALLLDLRNHGESEGTVTSLGYAEVADVEAAVDYLTARPEIDPQRIGLLGQSMGGATVLRSAARIPEVSLVIAESAYVSIEDNIANGVRELTGLPPFPFAPLVVFFGEQESDVEIQLVRPIDDLAAISPRPVMIIHGAQDVLVPVENGMQLYDRAAEPKELYIIEDAAHNPLYEVEPKVFESRILAFLNQHFGE